MPLDWEIVRANRLRDEQPIRLSDDEAGWLRQRRAEQAEVAAEKQRKADLDAALAAFTSKAAAAQKAGDWRSEQQWSAAAASIAEGKWPVSRVVAASPDITRFQNLRTALLYEGATARLPE